MARSSLAAFRAWCSLNAPIVDFVSKILIGLTGLTLTLLALQITRSQVEVQKGQLEVQRLQAEAQRAAHLPRFALRMSGQPRSRLLIVENSGGAAYRLEPSLIAFWRLSEHEPNTSKKVATAYIAADPLIYGTGPWDLSSKGTGELMRYALSGTDDWLRFAHSLRLTSQAGRDVGSQEYHFVARLRYQDIFAANHELYIRLRIDGFGAVDIDSPTEQLPAEEGRRLYRLYEEQWVGRGGKYFTLPKEADIQREWTKYREPVK